MPEWAQLCLAVVSILGASISAVFGYLNREQKNRLKHLETRSYRLETELEKVKAAEEECSHDRRSLRDEIEGLRRQMFELMQENRELRTQLAKMS